MTSNAVTTAVAEFADGGVEFPRLPAALESSLVRVGSWTYSTREQTPWAYDLDTYVREFESGDEPGDYAVVAHAGRGSASWALTYAVVADRLGVFIQSTWGSSHDDVAESAGNAERFAVRVRAAAALRDEWTNASLDDERRLAVVVSDSRGQQWAAWLRDEPVNWVPSPDALGDAAVFVGELT